MNKLYDFFDLKKASIFIITFPYLCFNYETIIHSPFFSFSQLLLILALIFLIDVLIKSVQFKLYEKIYTIMLFIILFISVLFFYGLHITTLIQNGIQNYLHFYIRGRTIIGFLLAFFILFILIFKKKTINYQYLNVFLILLGLISFINSFTNSKANGNQVFKSNFVPIDLKNSPVKPILLIISDEYASPDGLYQVYENPSIYNFSNELINKGWITKNSFYTYETSTIHSLSSLFNFNLSKNNQYGNEEINKIGLSKLLHASIADSLEKKKVKIINFGIFDLGKHVPLNRLYFYPTSFFEAIASHTAYYVIKSNTGQFNISGFFSSYYPTESHNKYIFNQLVDTLNTLSNNKIFTYVHLYMPHVPMLYEPDFPIRTQNNLINYKAYWDFTNYKLNILLTDLIKENKYRIILTGDHGYRSEKRINPHYTFSAFYGFDRELINKINSVQDLGSFINGGF